MGPCPHMHPRRGCINGLGRAPSPYGHPFGVPIIGRDLFFFWSLVHSPSARSRLQWAPIGCPYVHPSGAHYKRVRVKRCHPSGDNPFGVNFGQNYRDLGQNLRFHFFFFFAATLRGPLIPEGDMPSAFFKN